ncbi:sulfite exporter TauE/SafE family protein [Stutzerimonas kunmingensis]|uniref:sulfite exporter TauE/SafE family protein n=1 Tax=Pseudomonadota TaxID=1224 RepID=UPI0028A885E7|nr:sulfite exporter TauE/SafE family protein [Stutzerimonas kunmingensis]
MNDPLFYFTAITLTFLAAGLVKGVTGMGLPTVAMGLLGTVMPPVSAAALLVIPSFITNIWQLFSGASTLALLRRLWTMMLGIVLGSIAGVPMLVSVDPEWSGLALGVALVVYSGYALAGPGLSISQSTEPWLSPAIGLITGAVAGATGVFVMPAVPYLQALNLEKTELVQALGLSFTVSTLALAAGLLAQGAFRLDQIGLSGVSIVPALIGMWLGQKLRARISPARFRQFFLVALMGLGLELVLRPIF